jgi:hypothetical protein
MSNALIIALAVGVIAGLFIGRRLAERSIMKEPIYGGDLAKFFHRLACSAFSGGVPAGIVEVILGRNVVTGIILALCFVGVSFISLLIFALLENAPRQSALAEDRGWTAEKAKSSGL